jgi:hypothetical protein
MNDLAIIVPVMRRPEAAYRFMKSLVDSDDVDLWNVYAVCDANDNATRRAWRDVGAVTMISDRGHRFANKVQLAYEYTEERWLLLVGDDVLFHPGWLEAARREINDGWQLVATNDMHNPFVLNGTHATHPIIDRRWIDYFGASWDGPGSIAHQGYWHAYVDAEWTARAHEDGTFVFAPDCKIEHLHPTWTGVRTDPTYILGMKHYQDDAALFERRRREHGS